MQCPDGDTGVTVKNNLPQPDSSVFVLFFVFCQAHHCRVFIQKHSSIITIFHLLTHFTDSSDFDHTLGQDISSIVQRTNGEQDGYSSTF